MPLHSDGDSLRLARDSATRVPAEHRVPLRANPDICGVTHVLSGEALGYEKLRVISSYSCTEPGLTELARELHNMQNIILPSMFVGRASLITHTRRVVN